MFASSSPVMLKPGEGTLREFPDAHVPSFGEERGHAVACLRQWPGDISFPHSNFSEGEPIRGAVTPFRSGGPPPLAAPIRTAPVATGARKTFRRTGLLTDVEHWEFLVPRIPVPMFKGAELEQFRPFTVPPPAKHPVARCQGNFHSHGQLEICGIRDPQFVPTREPNHNVDAVDGVSLILTQGLLLQ